MNKKKRARIKKKQARHAAQAKINASSPSPKTTSAPVQTVDVPVTATSEDIRNALIDIAVASQRFSVVFNRMIRKMDAGEGRRYIAQFEWLLRQIDAGMEAAQLRISHVQGSLYDAGLPVTALNLEDFAPEDTLYVRQVLEPVILSNDGTVIRTGKVELEKCDKGM